MDFEYKKVDVTESDASKRGEFAAKAGHTKHVNPFKSNKILSDAWMSGYNKVTNDES